MKIHQVCLSTDRHTFSYELLSSHIFCGVEESKIGFRLNIYLDLITYNWFLGTGTTPKGPSNNGLMVK